jgi:regulator of sigma E protease
MVFLSMLITLGVLGVLIAVHELGHFLAARRVGVKVEKFYLGFGPRLLRKKVGDTEYGLAAVPLGGYVKLAGDAAEECRGKPYEYLSKSKRARAFIIASGPLTNYVFGFLCFVAVCLIGEPIITTRIGGVRDGFGAKEAGIAAGDLVRSVNGTAVETWDDFQRSVRDLPGGSTAVLEVVRGEETRTFQVVVKSDEYVDVFGKKHAVGRVGVEYAGELVSKKYGFFAALRAAVVKTADLTVMTYDAFWRMLTGQLSVKDAATGPVGVMYVTSKVAHYGAVAMINWMGILSLSLAIFNLLPIPVFDGGHIMFLGLAQLRGRSLSQRTEKVVTNVGMSLIICFVLFVTYHDISRFFGEKITAMVNAPEKP